MDLVNLLTDAVKSGASDIFIIAGLPLTTKVFGQMVMVSDDRLTTQATEEAVRGIYILADNRNIETLLGTGDDDFSFSLPSVSRFRVSAYKQRGSLAAVIRIVNFKLPDPREIGIPETVLDLTSRTRGIILVTGPAGSGKSTTLACMIDLINRSRHNHIITLEDPLEFLHRHQLSIVSQREISADTQSYVKALRAALRQSPDVILLGEMRDYETINVAMTAAETGHLVISTLHTLGAAKTIDRIIDAFPPNQQQQIRIQLSMVLQAVISQQLVPTVDSTVAPAFEILIANSAVRNMIRESKIHQIDSVIQASPAEGMLQMDASLFELVKTGRITDRTALICCANVDVMQKRLAAM